MTIRDFCKRRKITLEQLALEIGYSYGTLRNVSAGQTPAGLKMIRRLEKLSGGKISIKELRPDLYQ